jgi:hypothetical protein
MLSLLPHQQQCHDAVLRAYDEEERIISFQMATGAGKTRVLLALPSAMKHTRIVYVFPTLGLIHQFKNDYLDKFTKIFPNYVEASSNSSLSDKDLKKVLSRKTYCVITTYDSLPKVLQLAVDVDCVLFDEAHHADAPQCHKCMSENESKIKCVIRASATLNESDTPCFTYPFHQAVKDGVCRDYSTYCFIKKKGSEHELISYLEAHRKQTGNSKVMVFTTFTEAEKDGTTNVYQFMDQYRDTLTKIGGWMQGIVSSQSQDERQTILKTFESNADDQLSLLVSCRTIGEGVDTKKANVVLFVDPIRSTIMIIQRIGRGTRVYRDKEGVPLPEQRDGSVIVGIYIDPAKYEGKTEQEIDQLLKENMSEKGDFSPIFCVLAALRATDPDTYYQCLHFQDHQKTHARIKEQGMDRIEVPRDGNCFFHCVGLETGETHGQVRKRVVDFMEEHPENYADFLSDEDNVEALREEGEWNNDAMDVVVRATADMLGQTIHVHRPDGRIDEVGDGEEQMDVLLEGNHYTFLTHNDKVYDEEVEEKRAKSKSTAPKKRLFIDIDPDFRVLWKVSGDLTKDFTARIDSEIENDGLTLEERSLKRANEFKEFYEKYKRIPVRISNPKTEEDKLEKRLAYWFSDTKKGKNRKSLTIIYPSVEKILLDLLGETWYEKEDLEENALIKANEFKLFYKKHNRKPSYISNPKTKEEETEKSLDQWFRYTKSTKKGKGKGKLFISVEKILVDLLGEDWYENEDLEKNSLLKANKYKEFYMKHNRKPSCLKYPKTEDEETEKSLAHWFRAVKLIKKGKITDRKLFLSVEKILVDLLGEDWYDNEDLEKNALIWANEFKGFYEEHNRIPSCISYPKTETEETEKRLASWFISIRAAKNGKGSLTIYPSVEKIIVDLLGEDWYEIKDKNKNALIKANEYKAFYEKYDRKPLRLTYPKTEEEEIEKRLAQWLTDLKVVKNVYPPVAKILVDLLGDNWYGNGMREKKRSRDKVNVKQQSPQISVQHQTQLQENTCTVIIKSGINKGKVCGKNNCKTHKKEPQKQMTHALPNPQPPVNPSSEQPRAPRPQSQLSLLHKEYKTLRSDNLATKFHQHPLLWHEYHKVAEANEASFPDGQVPYQLVISFLKTYLATFHPKKQKTIVDMGCGTARVQRAFAELPNLTFYNLDHVACDERVTVADIAHTGLEDGDADVAILCLAMWGSNKEEYLTEAFRLLDPNGRLIIVEPSKRWMDEETGQHRLRDTLVRHGFTIVQEQVMTEEQQVHKFSLFVAKK